ncbi:MAG: TIGR03943 family protein [Paenibacillaceae bacterium]|nr:TIGR03943 family protein [Paenibacillaceae bacterium]
MQAAIFALFVLAIAWLIRTESLTEYIAPRMVIFVQCAAVLLAILAFVRIVSLWGESRGWAVACACGMAHGASRWRIVLLSVVLAIPLMFTYFASQEPIGSAMVLRKGLFVDKQARQLPIDDPYAKQYAPLAQQLLDLPRIVVTEEQFVDTSIAVDLFRSQFVGKSIEVSGFVHREPDMPAHMLVVARLAMACCAADALPYGFLVSTTQTHDPDTWVTVTGTMRIGTYRGDAIAYIDAQSIVPMTNPPKSPFVQTNDRMDAWDGGAL